MKKIDYRPWTLSGIRLAVSLVFPSYSTAIWVVGVGSLMSLLWSELRKPVNYASLKFNAAGFAFQKSTSLEVAAKWSEVKEVFYCRSLDDFANQIETEWQFLLCDGRLITILVEWPQRSTFAKAIIENLSQVSAEAVKSAMRQRQEGRWSVMAEGGCA